MRGGLRPVFRFSGSRGHDWAVERLEAKNLGSMHDHLSARDVRAVKKTPPPTPLASTSLGARQTRLGRPVDYVSVLRNRAGAKLSGLFKWSAWALGFDTAPRVPLGWQNAWAGMLGIILAPIPCGESAAAQWRG